MPVTNRISRSTTFIRNSPETQSFPASKQAPIRKILTIGVLESVGDPFTFE